MDSVVCLIDEYTGEVRRDSKTVFYCNALMYCQS